MKSKEEFFNFVDGRLKASLGRLEELRKTIKVKYFNWITILLIAGVLLLIGRYTSQAKWLLWPAIGFFLGGLVFVVLAQKPIKEFKALYKDQVINRIIDFIQPGMTYIPQAFVPESEFRRSGLFMKTPDRYRGEDMVTGKLDKTEVVFSEVRAQYKTETTDSKGNRRTQWHDIFRGIFFIADFNKEFITRTLVLPDTAEKMFGSFIGSAFQKMNKFRGELIKLENPEFEKEFAVYGQDQIEARYILTPDLMEKILRFRKEHGKSLYISFIDNKMYVAVSVKKDLFEPTFAKSLFDRGVLGEYFDYLNLVIGIVEQFNLNTRIWGKK